MNDNFYIGQWVTCSGWLGWIERIIQVGTRPTRYSVRLATGGCMTVRAERLQAR
jgi:hypothetical protein